MDDEIRTLVSCSSSDGSGEYTNSEEEEDVRRNDTNQRPANEGVAGAGERGDEPSHFDNSARGSGRYGNVGGLHGLVPPPWAANITAGNAPLSPSCNPDTIYNPELLEGDINNVFDLLRGPNAGYKTQRITGRAKDVQESCLMH